MRKLISFLGTGFYSKCIYTYEDKYESRETHFIQTAIYDILKQKNESIDEFYLFLTPEAKSGNFEKGNTNRVTGETYEGLKTVWERSYPNDKDKLKIVHIDSEQSEEKLWKLFDQMFDVIDENDELYFDITHSFRSIPLVSLIIANYAKTIKNAKIKKLLYGNYEMMDHDTMKAPIVDITSMARLLDWTSGVESFLRTGNPVQINSLTGENISKGNSEIKEIKELTTKLNTLYRNMVTCRGTTFENNLDDLNELFPKIKQLTGDALPQMTKLFEKIEEKLQVFGENRNERMWGVVKWCVDHELYQQAFTFAREFVISLVIDRITHIVDINKMKKREDRRTFREDVGSIILSIYNSNIKIKEENLLFPAIYEPIKEIVQNQYDNFKVYHLITDYRNNINHAGYERDDLKFSRIKSKSEEMLEKIKPLFFQ